MNLKILIITPIEHLKQTFELMKTFDYIYKPYLNKNELIQILKNAGRTPEEIMIDDLIDDTNGFDVKNGRYGDMFKMGVIDPLKVTKNALINATSVATTILSTNAIITHGRA